jgi:hypothetical protein
MLRVIWPWRRRRTAPSPTEDEVQQEQDAEQAKKISREALAKTVARSGAVTDTAARQAQLRDQNHFTDLFIESIRRST